jgi:cytoskeleton protein RodZ
MDQSWLREARERAGFSLSELSDILEVRPSYLDALEKGELANELGPSYVRSILSRYAVCVHIDPEQARLRYERESGPAAEPAPTAAEMGASAAVASRLERRHSRRGSRRHVVLIVAAIVVVAAIAGALLYTSGTPADSGHAAAPAPTPGATTPASSTSTLSVSTTVAATSSATAPATASTVGSVGGSGVSTSRVQGGSSFTTTTTTTAGSFTVVFAPSAQVWLEVTDQATGRVYFFGTKGAGERLGLEITGPAKAVVGKPEVLTVTLNGKGVAVPRALVWRLESTGITAAK